MFEYVASGLSFSRLNLKNVHDPEYRDYTNSVYSILRGKYSHEFSFLYNAWQEKIFGEWFQYYRTNGGINQLYSDSGGLQMVTKGIEITTKERALIYENQGLYSDSAMCFDEIPVRIVGDRSQRNDPSSRIFDWGRLDECARQTGRNVKDQIIAFQEMETGAKPIFIAQGNDLKSYARWCEVALEEIPENLQKFIGGIAMSTASLGTGTLEDVRRMFYYTEIRKHFPNADHLHLLGVGAPSRLLPVIVFMQTGLLKDVKVSYDSTSHTMAVQYGRYFMPNGEYIQLGRELNEKYERIYADMMKNVPIYEFDMNTFHKALNISSGGFNEKYGSYHPAYKTFSTFIVSGILNFMRQIDRLLSAEDELLKFLDESSTDYHAYRLLYGVKNADDFAEWERTVHSTVSSQAIKTERGTLEDL